MSDKRDDAATFRNLNALVQYRRRQGGAWINMAAYDVMSMAEKYAAECTREGDWPWEYRAVDIERDDEPAPSPRSTEV